MARCRNGFARARVQIGGRNALGAAIAAACCLAVNAAPAMAGTISYDNSASGNGAPPKSLGGFALTPFAADPGADDSFETTVPAPGGGALQFTPAMEHFAETELDDASWGDPTTNNYQGDVYWTNGGESQRFVLPANTRAFSFYVVPNVSSNNGVPLTAGITVTDQRGDTFGPTNVSGDDGQAMEFGFYGTGGDTIKSLTVTNESANSDLVLGEFAINTTAGPSCKVVSTVASWPAHQTVQVTAPAGVSSVAYHVQNGTVGFSANPLTLSGPTTIGSVVSGTGTFASPTSVLATATKTYRYAATHWSLDVTDAIGDAVHCQ